MPNQALESAPRALRSLDEVAPLVGLTRRQLYDRVRYGSVGAVRFGGRWMIPESTYARLVALRDFRTKPTPTTPQHQEQKA